MKNPRLLDWIFTALILFGMIAWFAPEQVKVVVYKCSLVSLFAVLGYWLDRSLFPYSRPDQVLEIERGTAMVRRAVVIAAVIIGGTLGI